LCFAIATHQTNSILLWLNIILESLSLDINTICRANNVTLKLLLKLGGLNFEEHDTQQGTDNQENSNSPDKT